MPQLYHMYEFYSDHNTASCQLVWQQEQLVIDDIAQRLSAQQPQTLQLLAVPNARLQKESLLLEWLEQEMSPNAPEPKVGELRKLITQRSTPDGAGVNPEEFWALGKSLGYATTVTWSTTGQPGDMDVLYQRADKNIQGETDEGNTQYGVHYSLLS